MTRRATTALCLALFCVRAHADETKVDDKRHDEYYVALFGDALVKADDKHDPQWLWDPLESTCRHASLSIL